MQTHLIKTCCNSGWCYEPLLETVALESRPLFRVLRHHHAQLPDIPLRNDMQALRLIANIPLIQRRKSATLVKKKAPSRSGILLLCT